METVLAKMRADVETYGWHCLSVNPREGAQGLSFTSTIGLAATFGHPEILIVGLSNKISHGILTDCVELIKAGRSFAADIEYEGVIGGGYKVIFKVVRQPGLDQYFAAAMRYYGTKPFRALIMFWPNEAHLFPWQISGERSPQDEVLHVV